MKGGDEMATILDTHNRRQRTSDDTWTHIVYRENGNLHSLDTPAVAVVPVTHKPVPRPCR